MQYIRRALTSKDLLLDFCLLDYSTKDELDRYLDLFYKCFGFRPNIDLSAFEWLNYGGKNFNFIFSKHDSSEFISAYSLLVNSLYFKGNPFKSALCNNVMTDSKYRGRRLFEQIGTNSLNFIREQGVEIVFGVPNRFAIEGHMKIGWKELPKLFFLQKLSDEFCSPHSNPAIERSSNFLEDENSAISTFHEKYELYFNRDHRWLNWRISKPNSDYRILKYKLGSVLKGYLIYKIYDDQKISTKKAHIIDFGYAENSYFKMLLSELDLISKQEGCSLINCWCLSEEGIDGSCLKEMKYSNSGESNHFIINTRLNFDSSNVCIDDWHLTLADNDVF